MSAANKFSGTHASRQRTALKKDFIQSCVDNEAIVDEAPYLHDLPEKKRGRKREKKVGVKSRHTDCRSLSPFNGISEARGTAASSYHFTNSEYDYAKKVINHLMDKNGSITQDGVASILASRVSHTTSMNHCIDTNGTADHRPLIRKLASMGSQRAILLCL